MKNESFDCNGALIFAVVLIIGLAVALSGAVEYCKQGTNNCDIPATSK